MCLVSVAIAYFIENVKLNDHVISKNVYGTISFGQFLKSYKLKTQ